ncbi:phosphotransferase family protein [Rhodococcus sp. D2-41]|uniref:Phosphotransferase family protein n=1 Tax=Speluncibacter jeojiensis TaxID=2710754 RepID=A0A9X4M5D5_9ACTN|nr:phosphotransferase family protein [Rhodococcus sp. D2-41]MDG3009061.1 phosphotransferase family protein [Rhodococcus sp. D2-41]MDG3015573.1 phosphotransferase family protein [Corynebacteriales bacterium D3-21]
MTSAYEREDGDFAELARPHDSRNDPELTGTRLQQWLAGQLPAEASPAVTDVQVPEANGMSNETVLFDGQWSENGTLTHHPLVARVAPAASAVPVFPTYDLDRQFQVMRTVAEHCTAPVPQVYWSEPSRESLGGEFFVMARVDGEVPPDVMPYNFGSWLTEASDDQRARLQEASVGVLAELHSITEPADKFPYLAPPEGISPLRHHVDEQRRYYEWASADGPRSPLIEAGFDWLEQHWPTDEGPTVLCWGDARIGNIMYRDFTPVAVLDWEMASLGPRELDLSWMIFLHRFFEDIATLAGLPGLPGFLRRDDVCARYRELTGYEPRDLDFYTLYAALRHAIIMFRIQSRAAAFGQAEAPTDPDDMIMHRKALEAMIDGTYWAGIASAGPQ